MSGSSELEKFIDELIERSIERGYTPKIFIDMRNNHGTIETIKSAVTGRKIPVGLERLKEFGLLGLSIEAAVLKFSNEFTPEEQEVARWRLEQMGYVLPKLEKKIQLPKEIKHAGESGDLVFFIGAGLSNSVGLPSWRKLAEKSLQDLLDKKKFNHAQIEQLKSLSPKQILSICQLTDKENFKQKIVNHLQKPESRGIYETINKIGCVCVTTNYDDLLENQQHLLSEVSTSKKPEELEAYVSENNEIPDRIYRREDIHKYLLEELGTVIHLHGCIIKPDTMVITTGDYLENYNDSNIVKFLKYLFEEKTVVFLGYGLEEDEILEHLLRRGRTQNNGNTKHFNIRGFFSWEIHLYEGLRKYYKETFGINLLGFIRDDKNHGAVEGIIEDWASKMKIRFPSLHGDIKIINNINDPDVMVGDILPRIKRKPKLLPLFFRKARGLKWFFPLQNEGYFKSKYLLPSKPSEREGSTSQWEAANYLANTAPELVTEEGKSYHKEFLSIIENTTGYAEKEKFSNYQLWSRFAQILLYIPYNLISTEVIEAVDYWLEDKHGSDLVAEVIGEKLLPKLLNEQDENVDDITSGLLSKLFKVTFKPYSSVISEAGQKADFQFYDYQVKKFIEDLASKSGKRLGKKGVAVFHDELTHVLEKLKKDRWSSVWQPAIEDHKQNSFHDDTENMLVLACRNSLTGFIKSSPENAKEYLRELLGSEYETIHRIAIYCAGQEREPYKSLWPHIINEKFFHANYQHEMWHFLKLNYRLFSDNQKKETLGIIQQIERKNKNGDILKEASARARSNWLAAIKDYGKDEKMFYQREVQIVGAESEHPSFSSYTGNGEAEIVHPNSPYTKDELNKMKISNLVEALKSFRSTDGWEQPSVFGLSQCFKDAIISEPLHYLEHLDKFENLTFAYMHSIVSAYGDLWREKANLPWDDIWPHLLQYISSIVGQEEFWTEDNIDTGKRDEYVADRNEVLKAIGVLIREGVQSDDHAFDEKHHGKAKDILQHLLENQKSDTFSENSSFDALTIAINSPRGQCMEALINVALRHCRIADRKNNGKHIEAWQEFQQCFDKELKRTADINYEFFALIPRYIPNFLYMSEEWIMKNLEVIFDQNDNKKWTCAIHGYAYLSRFLIEVYQHLKSHGHITRALNDKDLPQKCSIRFVQNAVHSFLADKEQIDDETSLIYILLSRGKSSEIHEIIRFICSFRPEDRERIIPRVYELWPQIQNIIREIDFSSENGRSLASSLCRWTEFLDQIDDENIEWLLEIAPYVHFGNFSRRFLGNLARISKQHPFDVNEILQKMIEGVQEHTYGFLGADEQIKTILENLVVEGGENGEIEAKETVSKFAAKGMFRYSEILQQIERRDSSNFNGSK